MIGTFALCAIFTSFRKHDSSWILEKLVNFSSGDNSISRDESDFEVKQALKEVAKAQYSCQTWWASRKDYFSKELILYGLSLQKKALKVTLNAFESDIAQSVILATSDRLERRLQRYLDRIK